MIILSLLKCNGVVIKTQDYRENDKLVWLYTDNLGKITMIAKGAKKSKSKFFANTIAKNSLIKVPKSYPVFLR